MASINFLELAEHYLKISQPQKGLEEIAKAPERNQKYFYVLAQCHFDLKQYQQAKKALVEGLKDSPDDLYLLFFLVSTERRLGHYKDAERHVRQLRSVFPERADVLELYAKTMLDQRKYSEMHEAYKKAILMRGEAPNRVLNASIALMYSKPEAAIKQIKEALKNDPENAYAHNVAAQAYKQSWRLDKYKEHALMAARLEPNEAYYRGQANRAKVMASPIIKPLYGLYYINHKYRYKPIYLIIALLYLFWAGGIILNKNTFSIIIVLIFISFLSIWFLIWLLGRLVHNYYYRILKSK